VSIKRLSKNDKQMLTSLAQECFNKSIVLGVPTAPLKTVCDLLIIDDKSSVDFPKGSSIKFTYGLYVMFNPMSFQTVCKHIAALKGIPNLIISCTSSHNQRDMYAQVGAPKTSVVQLMMFSKNPGLHVPWLSLLPEEGTTLTVPLMVPIFTPIFSFFCLLFFRFPHFLIRRNQRILGHIHICILFLSVFGCLFSRYCSFYNLKHSINVHICKAISTNLDKEVLRICDLSPHLGHKLTASILFGHCYRGYVEDASDSIGGISNLIMLHVDQEKMNSFLTIEDPVPDPAEIISKKNKKRKPEESSEDSSDDKPPKKRKTNGENQQQKVVGKGKTVPQQVILLLLFISISYLYFSLHLHHNLRHNKKEHRKNHKKRQRNMLVNQINPHLNQVMRILKLKKVHLINKFN
jgi:hypothetical protein